MQCTFRALRRLLAPGTAHQARSAGLLAHLCTTCSSTSAAAGATPEAGPEQDAGARARMVNKLLYRSRQRGFLELDLLVGLWAEQQLPAMDMPMLQQFTAVLDQENPDLFKWLTGQAEAPSELQANPAYQALKQHVAQQLADSCHAGTQAAAGKEWLRGWDDSWRSAMPAEGEQAARQAA